MNFFQNLKMLHEYSTHVHVGDQNIPNTLSLAGLKPAS